MIYKNKNLPWVVYLFLLICFILILPYDTNYSVKYFSDIDTKDAEDEITLIEKGHLGRRIGLFALGIYSIIVIIIRKKQNNLHVNGVLGWLIIFYSVLIVLSIIWSQDIHLSVRRVGIYLLLSLGAFALAIELTLYETVLLTIFICVITLLTSIGTEIVLKTFQPFNSNWRFSGVLHPVSQGWNCGFLSLMSISLTKFGTKKRMVYIGIALFSLFFLVLTRSRMAFFSFIISAGVYAYLFLPISHKIKLFFICSLILYAFIISYLIGYSVNFKDFEGIISFGRGEEGVGSIRDLTGRVPLWIECLRYFVKRPILGYGYGAFYNSENIISITNVIGWVPSNSHSAYIETLLGLGIVGAITLLFIIIKGLTMSLKLMKKDSDYSIVVATLFWVICNMFTDSIIVSSVSFPTFICFIFIAKLGFIKYSNK